MKPCRSFTVACWLTLSVATPVAAQSNSTTTTALAELTKPAKGIPFKAVILATTQHRILDCDSHNAAHRTLFQKLSTAAAAAESKARAEGVFSTRANEASNHMEIFVKAALKEAGRPARTPVTTKGEAQSTSYPDVEILSDPPCYLELKTYNSTTADTTQRSFYYSPSEHPKVTQNALHLLLAYELEKITRAGKPAFIPVHWKLLTLQDLQVDLKFEFNQSNRGLYGKEAGKAILAEGQEVKDR